jgi:uncharacterized protein YjbJ (UPF0337 family)
MDENRVSRTAKELGGKIEEGAGRARGDAGMAARGTADQVIGRAQDAYGRASGAAATFDS